MRSHILCAALVAFAAASLPASAANTPQQANMKTCAANWKAMSAADQAKTKYTAYMGTCMKSGGSAGVQTAAPAGGSAKCKDGKTVTYKTRSGTCSGHGGVATWM